MRRRLILFLLLCPLLVKAQVGDYRTDFAIGANAGYMLSNVGFIPEVPQKMLGGLTGGLTLRYTCEKYFKSICAIVAEVNLARMQTASQSIILMTLNGLIHCSMSVR